MSNSRKKAEATRAVLVDLYPQCFMPKGAAKLPLKINIHHDLIAAMPEADKESIHLVLGDYTRGNKYLECLTRDAPRINLLGNPCGKVDRNIARRADATLRERRYVDSLKNTIAKLETENRRLWARLEFHEQGQAA